MGAEDVGYQHQTQAAVGPLGGEERGEQLFCRFVADAAAVVGYLDAVGFRLNLNQAVGTVADAFGGVAHYVDHDALHQHRVDADFGAGCVRR